MKTEAIPFIQSIRKASALENTPRLGSDSKNFNSNGYSRLLVAAKRWLNPTVVSDYDPSAFDDLAEPSRSRLSEAVERFRRVASEVPSEEPPSDEQFRTGLAALDELRLITGEVAREEWLQAAGSVIDRVEGWAKESGWLTRRKPSVLQETLLGEYKLDDLFFYADDHLYTLNPKSRFSYGGLGNFDLALQPSFESTVIYRTMRGEWMIFLETSRGLHLARQTELDRESFHQAVAELRSRL